MTATLDRAPTTAATTTGDGTSSSVFSAWSCTVRLVVSDASVLAAAAADLTAFLEQVDVAASRFRRDSALSVANARPGRTTPIPPLLVELVVAALDAAEVTDGAVDPTLGRPMRAIGYDRDISLLPIDAAGHEPSGAPGRTPTGIPPVGGRPGWRDVRLHRAAGLLGVPVGTALDLGATAKAWTADRAAATLAARYGVAVLVEIGGDVAVAGDAPDGGWRVRVAERAGTDGPLVLLRHGGLATSTTTVRRWQHQGRSVHHILDPKTNRPADGPWRTASVAATSALRANIASTAAIVLGDAAADWLEAQRVAARLVGGDGAVLLIGDWPDEARARRVGSPARSTNPAITSWRVGRRPFVVVGGRS